MIAGTHISYLHICHRKLWLFANNIRMEHDSDTVYEGKLIGETSYPQRPDKYTEIEVDGVKIDFFDAKNRIVHEVKKSDKMEQAHVAQVKYYIYKLRQHGVAEVSGIIEYPKLRQRTIVPHHDVDEKEIQRWEREVADITSSPTAPPTLSKKSVCRNCSYHDFCYAAE